MASQPAASCRTRRSSPLVRWCATSGRSPGRSPPTWRSGPTSSRNPPEAQEGSYWIYDARIGIGIGAADDRWNVSLWGKNLADERYRSQVIFSSSGFGETWGMPRTYGVTFSMRM